MSDYHDDDYVIENQDFSHPYTTDVKHIKELYQAAIDTNSKSILEIGSYKGISTVALALAARKNNGFVYAVDLCDEISNDYRIKYWMDISPPINHLISAISASSLNYLQCRNIEGYDFIFHDAGHGDGVIPELIMCWQQAKKVFAMHDFDAITEKDAFIKILSPSFTSVTEDSKGRMLAIFYK